MNEILIGVSACLLGEQVRYDGGHKRNAVLLDKLAFHVRFVAGRSRARHRTRSSAGS
jgi:uncharacterized protein YbbK (DUF523 family)